MASTEQMSGLAGWVVDVMDALGGPGAGLLIAAENLFPPLPSELVLPLAGFAASVGALGLFEAIAWCTAGSLVGAWALYGIGAWMGQDRARAWAIKLPLVGERDLDRTQSWFQRHGNASVFYGRMVPGLRSFISLPAGAQRMPLWRFSLLTAAGSLIWNSVLIVAGYELGQQWHRVEAVVGDVQLVVVAVVVFAIAWFITHRLRRRHHPTPATQPKPADQNAAERNTTEVS